MYKLALNNAEARTSCAEVSRRCLQLTSSIYHSCLFCQLGKYQKAFEHLGNALTFDPHNYKVRRSATGGGSPINKGAELGFFRAVQ